MCWKGIRPSDLSGLKGLTADIQHVTSKIINFITMNQFFEKEKQQICIVKLCIKSIKDTEAENFQQRLNI